MNDVILSLVTAAIRRYLELHGDKVKGRLFRMMVPVNLRGSDNPGELGNRISLVPVTVPLDIANPRKLLLAVHRRTEFLKRAHTAELVSLAGGLIGMLPTSAQAVAGHIISRLPFTPFNMVCTNVPGPQYPLYLLGHKMLHCYPYVPIGGEMALNCAILTYNGTAYFGFSGEVHAAPDLRRLENLLKLSFVELREAAGDRRGRRNNEQAKSKKMHAKVKGKIRSSPVSKPASVDLSIPPSPVASVESPIAVGPPVKEEKRSYAIDRVAIVSQQESSDVVGAQSAAQLTPLVGLGPKPLPDHSSSRPCWFFLHCGEALGAARFGQNAIFVLTGRWPRLGRVFKYWLGQWKHPRYRAAGILHIFIFAGFIVLATARLHCADCRRLPELRHAGPFRESRHVYNVLTDYAATIVFLCMVIAVVRRLVFKPARYAVPARYGKGHTADAIFLLALIAILMVADSLFAAAKQRPRRSKARPWKYWLHFRFPWMLQSGSALHSLAHTRQRLLRRLSSA